MPKTDEAVVVTDLVKRYRSAMPPAVDSLSFSVPPGEVFGLLGPNGAGKTTTVRMLTTLCKPTSGRALLDGVDVTARPSVARRLLAVVPQRNNLDRSLSVRQNLVFHSAYHGVSRIERRRRADALLERMQLTSQADGRVDQMSGGQSQRLMIARALMHRPKVMFLDEPSAALDPQARLFVHDRIAELRHDGVTVVLTTHDMEEAAKLCDRVGIVDHGKLLALDSPAALTSSLAGGTTVTVTARLGEQSAAEVCTALERVDSVHSVEHVPAPVPGGSDSFRLQVGAEPGSALSGSLKALGERQCEVRDVAIREVSLEDVFIHLTGKGLR